MQQDVLVLLGLEERNTVNFELPKCAFVESKEQAMYMSAQFVVETREEFRDLLLRDGGREVNIPDGQAGEGLRITREQAVEEGRTAAQVADDKERLFDRLRFVPGKENVIQQEKDSMHELTDRPDRIEHEQKDESLTGELSGGVFGGEEGAIGRSPEQAEIVIHSVQDPYLLS